MEENARAFHEPFPGREVRLAQSYIPVQVFEPPFEPEEGFANGTIFPSLHRPYHHEFLH